MAYPLNSTSAYKKTEEGKIKDETQIYKDL